MINIGIIGTNHGGLHAELLSQRKEVKIKYLCALDIDKVNIIANRFNIPKRTENYHDILGDNEIDLVIIASPNHLHREMFEKAVLANKHIILEKPAGVNSSEIQGMISFIKKSNFDKFVIVDHEMRFNPKIKYLKTAIEKGAIGKIKEIHLTKYHGTIAGENTYREWEVLEDKGGGQVQLVGSHFIDIARFILDFPKFINGEIHKRISNEHKVMANKKIIKSSAEDIFKAELYFENNRSVFLHDSILGDGHKTLDLKIVGTKGSFFYDDKAGLFKQNKMGKIKGIEITDPLPEIIHSSKSLISGSLKYIHNEIIKSLEENNFNKDFCSLEQAKENSKILENCKIV